MRRLVLLVVVFGLTIMGHAQTSNVAGRLHTALTAAGVPITGVSIGDVVNKATWTVQPASLQVAAQPTIDAFNVNDPAHLTAELDAQVKTALDNERLISALVWTIIDTYSPPATIAKYTAARTKIISSYHLQPWIP